MCGSKILRNTMKLALAEALAIRWALFVVKSMGFKKIVVENDNVNVTIALKKNVTGTSTLFFYFR